MDVAIADALCLQCTKRSVKEPASDKFIESPNNNTDGEPYTVWLTFVNNWHGPL
jgi:hypothetical protein